MVSAPIDITSVSGTSSGGAQSGPDPGDQLLRLEGLGDVVVGAGLQSGDDVVGVGAGGEHDDRDAGDPPHLTADVDPVAPGEHEIQQDEIGPELLEDVERPGPAGTPVGDESLLVKDELEHLGQGGVVVDHEYPLARGLAAGLGHAPTSSPSPTLDAPSRNVFTW
jgi:hypothetical protein